ncbi:MAG: MBL fold metallo-hydrolase [Bacteroidetes bacterium]|nr:MBL fold metallo-hydrolase [Bacteroidota bacterium]
MLHIKSFEFSPIRENTYLVYNDAGECIIIDPGCYFDEEKQMLSDFIETNNLKPVKLVNTHCHLDHVFGNKYVSEKYNLPLHLHKLEERMLNLAPASGLMYNLPFDNYSGDFIFIDEGDTLTLGNDSFKIFHTPGHSEGSLTFYNEAGKFIISGDVLFQNSIGRSDLPGGDSDILLKSIKDKLLTLPDETIVYSGHGPTTTIGEERRSNPFL